MKTPIRRILVFAAVFLMLFALLAFVIGVFRFRPRLDVEPMRQQATQLLANVGPEKVCEEANQIFGRFGTEKLRFFEKADLTDYPAIAALGKVDGIWPGPPAYIKIRIGTHMDGYIMEIADTNSSAKYEPSTNCVELVKSCIFVHR
jgi:hypothetical protein